MLKAERIQRERVPWCCGVSPVCSLSGVGETEDGAELHPQDEVEDEERLVA